MPKIESEKIDCLHRPCSSPAPRGKIESTRTHSKVSEQFDSFSLLKLLFLVRNCHERLLLAKWHPKPRKTAKTAVFRHRWQAWMVVERGYTPAPKDATKPAVFFRFFSFFWLFNIKQREEVIFRLSRPVSCKNQENGSGKQWYLHAPVKLS